MATSFEDLSRVGVAHFNGIYKEHNKATIAEVVKWKLCSLALSLRRTL